MARGRKAPERPKRRSPGTGTVGRRSDGRLFAILPPDLDPARRPVYGPGRRRRFADRAQAEAYLAAEIARRRSPEPRSASASEPLGAYLARWFRSHEPDWPERTARAYAVSLRRWAVIGDVPLGALTREVVQGGLAALGRQTWQRRRRDGTPTTVLRPYSRRTIQQARTLLHQALDDLIPDVLSHNPARVRSRARRAADAEQPVWSAEQAERFKAAAERTVPGIALAVRLILERALRPGEVVALKIDDIDAAGMTLRIDETPGLKRGTSGPTKTRRVRDVPLSLGLLARIRAHRQAYPAVDPHLFTVAGRRISQEYFLKLWHRTVRVARLPPLTPKDGRATCATILLDGGWPLPEVARLLGHASIATTAGFYARNVRRRSDQLARLGERLDAALQGESGAEATLGAVKLTADQE